jgi:hypothetical protein
MKVDPGLKWIFYLTFSVLYISGVFQFALGPTQSLALRVHGIVGLWFLYFLGHFFKAHIQPSLRQLRHRKTGITLWASFLILSVSVPFLYYLGNDFWRNFTVALHTYVGFVVVVPLGVHIFLAIRERQ